MVRFVFTSAVAGVFLLATVSATPVPAALADADVTPPICQIAIKCGPSLTCFCGQKCCNYGPLIHDTPSLHKCVKTTDSCPKFP